MQKAKTALPLTAIALSSCAGFTLQDKYVEARLLSGQGYTVISNAQRIEKGQDASFKIRLKFARCRVNYPNTSAVFFPITSL